MTSDAPADLSPNTGSIALIIEGGGSRDAYLAAVIVTMLKAGIRFPRVYGISAGAELAADYLAQAVDRAENYYPSLSTDSNAAGLGSLLRGGGFLNTAYVYLSSESGSEAGDRRSGDMISRHPELAFDFSTFQANPADIHVEALEADTGKTRIWTKKDLPSLFDLMQGIAATCSYPLATPKIEIDGHRYIDGGMGDSHGLCLEAAKKDGFERFFIVRSRPQGYRMPPLNIAKKAAYRTAYAKYPKVYQAICERPSVYNDLLDEVDRLADSGDAYVFYPETMPITYKTTDTQKLKDAYQRGLHQSVNELNRWIDWIFEG